METVVSKFNKKTQIALAAILTIFIAFSGAITAPTPAEAKSVSASTYKSYVKKYCGKGYRFKANQNLRSGVLALASGNTLYFSKRLNSKSVSMRKYAARHECSHMLQFKTYPNFNPLVKKTNKLFKRKGYGGVEALADCMAQQMGSSKSLMRYQKTCSKSAKNAAKKVIRHKKI